MKRTAVVVLAALLTATWAALAQAKPDPVHEMRQVTASYHSLPKAIADGFVPFSLEGTDVATCFDNPAGGMGIHYVRNIDGVVDALDPEAMVYEIAKNGQPKLVGVEYLIPAQFVEDANGNPVNVPELFGEHFHKHTFLPVYILHVWVWRDNPSGMFADWNPAVRPCP